MYYPLLRQSLRIFLTRIYLLLSNLAKKLNVMYIIVYDARSSKFYFLFSPEMNSHDRIILWNYFFFFRWLCHFSVTIQKTMTSLCILIFYLPKISRYLLPHLSLTFLPMKKLYISPRSCIFCFTIKCNRYHIAQEMDQYLFLNTPLILTDFHRNSEWE